MLATTVLASGIRHLTDARYFAAWEVDYLAFPLGETTAEPIGLEYVEAMREWIAGPRIVAELGAGDDFATWAGRLAAARIDLALMPSTAPAAAPHQLAAAGIKTIFHLQVNGYDTADDLAETLVELPAAEYCLLDFTAGGITYADLSGGHPFALPDLNRLLRLRPCLLDLELAGADPKPVAGDLPLAGYAVRGGHEEKVGYKSFDDLDILFEGLETFD